MKPIFAVLAACAALSFASAPAQAQSFRELMEDIGLQKRKQEKMDFSERAPLVVPPTLNELPPPENASAVAAVNPNWPTDPDVLREQEEEARNKVSRSEQRDYLRNPSGQIYDIRAKEREVGVHNDPDKTRAYQADLQDGRISRDELNAVKKKRAEQGPAPAQAYVEPERRRLTDPPPGYRAPSAAQPYGPPGEEKKKKSSIFSKLNPFD